MQKPVPSRSYNPLHFEDLSPQRFEDLTRSLIYDFRDWASIEAVGRSGSDQGVDIRGMEKVRQRALEKNDDEDEDISERFDFEQREWIFQCKRHRRLGPKQVGDIVDSDLSRQPVVPYGYVLVATCDFSHAAREAFRQKMVEHGVQEFYLWGKGELEDRLYQPKNDHLLFAYFGISLQVARKSKTMQLRADLALKRRLVKVVGDVRERHFKPVLLRDPNDVAYPTIDPLPDSPIHLPWNYWSFSHHAAQAGLWFEVGRANAYVNWTTGEWDYIEDDLAEDGSFRDLGEFAFGPLPEGWLGKNYYSYWRNLVPAENQARLILSGRIPYERILLVDEIGDAHNEGPHILIDFLPGETLVKRTFGDLHWILEAAGSHDNRALVPDEEKRVRFFPKEIPDEELVWRDPMSEAKKI